MPKVEEGTPFDRWYSPSSPSPRGILPGEDAAVAMYGMASEMLSSSGYEHYEVRSPATCVAARGCMCVGLHAMCMTARSLPGFMQEEADHGGSIMTDLCCHYRVWTECTVLMRINHYFILFV